MSSRGRKHRQAQFAAQAERLATMTPAKRKPRERIEKPAAWWRTPSTARTPSLAKVKLAGDLRGQESGPDRVEDLGVGWDWDSKTHQWVPVAMRRSQRRSRGQTKTARRGHVRRQKRRVLKAAS